jgi:hypothetical protein
MFILQRGTAEKGSHPKAAASLSYTVFRVLKSGFNAREQNSSS